MSSRPHGHTLIFEDEVRVDMRYVCPEDVKQMLSGQAKSICWRMWAAKHDNEGLKEGIWLEPALALMRKKTKEDWTGKRGKKIGVGRWLDAATTFRHWLVG